MILGHYEAYRRGDTDEIVSGWHSDGRLTPLPGGPSYVGPDEIGRFLRQGLNDLEQFDFRVYTILEQNEHALIFGRYSVRENGVVVEKGIFWIGRRRGPKLSAFEAYENVGEAFAAFRRQLAAE